MRSEKRTIRIELLTPMLGTVPKDPEVYKNYIATKAETLTDEIKEEVETVEEMEEKGWTGFHTDDSGIFIYDYMIRGFIKTGIEVGMENGEIPKITSYKKWIDRMVFVFPRKIRFLNKEKPDDVMERPLRAMTAKGPRVSLVRSDIVNEGTVIEFEIELLEQKTGKKNDPLTWEAIEKAFAYGEYYGLGQWRGSGGYGRFKVIK